MMIVIKDADGLKSKQTTVNYVKDKPYQERFVERIVDVCADGRKETWELEKVEIGESRMYVTYKLKKVGKYET